MDTIFDLTWRFDLPIENLHIRDILFFLDIAKGSSFFKAAVDHDISQSSFSKAIIRLEKELDLRLIDRSHYPVTLTLQGEQFYSDLKELIPGFRKMKNHILAYSKVRNIRLMVVPTIANFGIQQIIDDFGKIHEDIPVHIREKEDPQEAVKALLQGETDFCIIHKPFLPLTHLRLTVFYFDRLYVIIPKDHRLAGNKEISLSDLWNETFITSRYSYTILRDICAEAEFTQLNILNNVPRPTIISLVEMGKGVAIYYKSDLDLFRLDNIVLKPIMGIPPTPLTLVSSQSNELIQVQKTFIDFIVSAFRKRKKLNEIKTILNTNKLLK
jgi:DNA-binding transcriptional LysR family regulator